ncbi:MAG: hypothetical protein RMK29_00390 [Myxococcales bacterium]|nr:hypothetical protein [Myxococcota bacterium]MDW8280134.1 hypothetical protein [Myxococcales bacterium]
MLPCNGKEAAVPPANPLQPGPTARMVMELLRASPEPRYVVLPPDIWKRTAQRKFRGKTTEVQAIANALKAELVVGCWLEAPGPGAPYRLTVALYNHWAEPLSQHSFDLPTARVDGRSLRQRAEALYRQIDLGLGLIPPEPKKEATKGPRAVAQAEDSEPAPLPPQQPVRGPGPDVPLVPPDAEARALYYRRPPWRPIFQLELGYLFNGRHFTDEGSGRTFNASGTHGIRLHAEVYPLAGLRPVPLAAAGLGFRLTALLPFWPDVKQINDRGEQMGLYGASEYRVEAGWLRWHHAFLASILPPEAPVHPAVELEALYGYHRFDLTAKENILVLDLPSSGYSYLGGAAALRLHILRRMQVRAGLALAGMLDLGPMSEPGAPNNDPRTVPRSYYVYGPGSGWLWRAEAGLMARLVAGLSLGVGGFYEQKLLSFEGTGDILLRMQCPEGGSPCKVTSAKDEYGGFFLTLGYVY